MFNYGKHPIVIKHESPEAPPSIRFRCPGATDFVLTPGHEVEIVPVGNGDECRMEVRAETLTNYNPKP